MRHLDLVVETQFGTNHLGHFLLVNRLRPLLAGGPARIVNLSSAGHRFSDVVLDDVNFEQTPYDPWQAYGRSKTANILFAVELDRRGRDARTARVRGAPGDDHHRARAKLDGGDLRGAAGGARRAADDLEVDFRRGRDERVDRIRGRRRRDRGPVLPRLRSLNAA